ncbi:MAG: COX15/CtaA family protein [Proteobacteria bacterium]|nr:COX15/CtaA family protein [Pseudomonadota bacterium]
MNRYASPPRSTPVAIWLFALAALVFLMVLLGGATRLTHSGLSITEWKPIKGAIPPLNTAEWTREFQHYQQIPEYRLVNRGMSLDAFKGIYWWEWWHRLVGRLVGLAFILPFGWFWFRGELPKRLIWRCLVLFGLGGLQGLIGWWMVSSGLAKLTSVAPERLAIHLGAALILFVALIWTGLEALNGPERVRPSRRWTIAAGLVLGMAYVQCLLGALVAGNRAGLIYNDWPLMNGRFLAPISWQGGFFHAFLHDQALVQFDHRMLAYALLLFVSVYAGLFLKGRMPEGMKVGMGALLGLVWLQAALGIATLMAVAPLWLAMIHQTGAVLVLTAATAGLWSMLRFEQRSFGGGIGSRAL